VPSGEKATVLTLVVWPFSVKKVSARGWIPEPDGPVSTCGCKASAVGREGDGVDNIGVALQNLRASVCRYILHDQRHWVVCK
jgi:hypothetical protein